MNRPTSLHNLPRLLSVLCMVAMAASTAQAQSLSELYSSALTHDATYLAAMSGAQATDAKGDQSTLLPTVNLSASHTRYRYEATAVAERRYGTQAATISATQPLYRPLTWASYQQGQVQHEQARVLEDQARQDLILRLSQAYFDVLIAKDTLALLRAQKAANAEQLAAAKRNFEVGTATITDTHEAQARFDLTTSQEIVAANDLALRQLALSTIVGKPNPQPLPLRAKASPAKPQPDEMQSWVNLALGNQVAVKLAEMGLSLARHEVDKATAGHKPTLDGVLSYGNTRNLGGTASSLTPDTTRSNTASAALVLNVPIFAGGTTQAKVRETLALQDQAQTQLDAAKRLATQNTQSAWLSVMAGQSQVRALEAAETSSKSALEANQLGYQVGVRINIDVLNAQTQLYQTRRDLSKARYDLFMSHLKLKQSAGLLQPTDLDEISQQLVK